MHDGPKFKYRKLLNIVKIRVNISGFTLFIEPRLSFVLISITNDKI